VYPLRLGVRMKCHSRDVERAPEFMFGATKMGEGSELVMRE